MYYIYQFICFHKLNSTMNLPFRPGVWSPDGPVPGVGVEPLCRVKWIPCELSLTHPQIPFSKLQLRFLTAVSKKKKQQINNFLLGRYHNENRFVSTDHCHSYRPENDMVSDRQWS